MANNYNLSATLFLQNIDASNAMKSLQTSLAQQKFSIFVDIVAKNANWQQLNNQINGIKNNLTALNAGFGPLNTNAEKFASTFAKIASVQSPVQMMGRHMSDVSTNTSRATDALGRLLMTYFTLTKAAQAFKQSLDFEKEIVRFSQITGSSLQSGMNFGKLTRQSGAKWGSDSKDLMGFSSRLAQSSFKPTEIKEFLDVASRLSLSSEIKNVEDFADSIILLRSVFGQNIKQIEDSMGKLISMSVRYPTEVKSLAISMSKAGGPFKASGEDLNTLISASVIGKSKTMLPDEVVGTSLNSMVSRIRQPATISKLKNQGIDLLNEKGNFIGFTNAIGKISERTSSLDEADPRKAQIVQDAAGIRNTAVFTSLIENYEELLKVQNELRSTNGLEFINEQASVALQSFPNKLQKTREEFNLLVDSFRENQGLRNFSETILVVTNTLLKLGAALSGPLSTTLPLLLGLSAGKFAGWHTASALSGIISAPAKPAPVASSARNNQAGYLRSYLTDYSDIPLGTKFATRKNLTPESQVEYSETIRQIKLERVERRALNNIYANHNVAVATVQAGITKLGFALQKNFQPAINSITAQLSRVNYGKAGKVAAVGGLIGLTTMGNQENPYVASATTGLTTGLSAGMMGMGGPTSIVLGVLTAFDALIGGLEREKIKLEDVNFAEGLSKLSLSLKSDANILSPTNTKLLRSSISDASGGMMSALRPLSSVEKYGRGVNNMFKGDFRGSEGAEEQIYNERMSSFKNRVAPMGEALISGRNAIIEQESVKSLHDFQTYSNGLGKELGLLADILDDGLTNFSSNFDEIVAQLIDEKNIRAAHNTVLAQANQNIASNVLSVKGVGQTMGGLSTHIATPTNSIGGVPTENTYAYGMRNLGTQQFADTINKLPIKKADRLAALNVNASHDQLNTTLSNGKFTADNWKLIITDSMKDFGPAINSSLKTKLDTMKFDEFSASLNDVSKLTNELLSPFSNLIDETKNVGAELDKFKQAQAQNREAIFQNFTKSVFDRQGLALNQQSIEETKYKFANPYRPVMPGNKADDIYKQTAVKLAGTDNVDVLGKRLVALSNEFGKAKDGNEALSYQIKTTSEALKVLSNESGRLGTLFEQLNELQREEGNKLGLGEDMLTADPGEKMKINRELIAAQAAAQGDNFSQMDPMQKAMAIKGLNRMPDMKNVGGSGMSGKEVKDKLIKWQFPQMFAGDDAAKKGLENEIVGVKQNAQEAAMRRLLFQEEMDKKFLTSYESINVNFLNSLNTILNGKGWNPAQPQAAPQNAPQANNAGADINNAIVNLNTAIANFDKAVGSIPTSIDLQGNHNVSVLINGADALAQMEKPMTDLVKTNVGVALERYNKALAGGSKPSAINPNALV